MPKKYKRKCDYCKKEYIGSGSRFCSHKCHVKWRKGKFKGENSPYFKQIKIKCILCERVVYVKRNRTKARFCSKRCYNEWQKNKKFSDEYKKKISIALSGKEKTQKHKENLSKAIKKLNRTGKMASGWKGGLTKINVLIRSSIAMSKWKNKILKRDNYTCVRCGARSGKGKKVYLEVHHNKPLALIIKQNNIKSVSNLSKYSELWDLKNGVTLCKKCHSLTDTFGGKYKIWEKSHKKK